MNFLLEFSRLSYCSVIKVLTAFSEAACLVYHTLSSLSRTFFKFFFYFSLLVSETAFSFYQSSFYLSRTFLKSKRRRRDLNPRAAINDLHPFQGCPFSLLGTSPTKLILLSLFLYNKLLFSSFSGEGGIRTHAPLRTNGFQDRLVMTTSIPLRI